MGKRKKICLFIVEGYADESSLAIPLRNIFKSDPLIRFEITYGDLLTKPGSTRENIVKAVGDVIKKHIKMYKFKQSDIIKVVHIIDMDGCYIPNEKVFYSDDDLHVKYMDDGIYTKNVQSIIYRNRHKSDLLIRICEKNEIFQIPYFVYYFSCNMDHVFHDNANLNSTKKVELADQFADKYKDDGAGFITCITRYYPANIERDMNTSWQFIQMDCNSLKRYSNFCLFFDSF